MNSKERARLRGLASTQETIIQVGKGGITPNVIASVDTALSARELIKGKVLETAGVSSREIAEQLALETNSEVVQVIGSKFVLYRRNVKEPKIELPKARKR